MTIKTFFFGDIAPPPERAAWVRAEQFAAYMKTAPLAAGAMVINALILTIAFWGEDSATLLLVWSYSALLVAGHLLVNSLGRKLRPRVPAKVLRRVTLNSASIGLVWASLFFILFVSGDDKGRTLTGMVAASTMCGGAICLAVLPRACMAHVTPIAVAIIAAALIDGSPQSLAGAGMMFFYALLLQRIVAWLAQNFVSERLKTADLAESSDVISLLLHDFETHSSDWLWQIDRGGRLNRVSERFSEAVRRPRETLEGEVFQSFFDAEHGGRLAELFAHERTFRDLVLPVDIAGERRWWSISARPQRDGAGVFIGYRGVSSDVTDAKNAEAKIAYMAHYDALTKLPNRTTMTAALERAVERQKTDGTSFAVMCVDLDKFKAENDTMGHPAGDSLLRAVAARLTDCVDPDDVVARFGGDEFVVLKADANDLTEVTMVAESIVDVLLEPFDLNGNRAMVSGSVGVAIAPDHGDTAEILLKQADLALYRAKADGRGRMQIFETTMDRDARRRMVIEQDLRRAIYESDELELFYQPQIHADVGRRTGYEALLRWRRPNGELIMPTEFIDVAEESGLIIPLGEWVIRRAIKDAASWAENATVAVNLSPIQMKNPALISTVVTALAASGLPPSRLEIEITESVLLQETDANLKTLHALKDIGAQIALDDFGTGYSSLNYLRAFPFDKIKIDKCFVGEMEARDDCRAIIRAVMTLATSLGMRVTAEGVENERQVKLLMDEGCVEMQGYFYSQAIAAAEIPQNDAQTTDAPKDSREAMQRRA